MPIHTSRPTRKRRPPANSISIMPSSDHGLAMDRVDLEFQREPVHVPGTMTLPFRHIRNRLRAGRVHAGTPAPDLVA